MNINVNEMTLEEVRKNYNLTGRLSSKPSYVAINENFEIVAEEYSNERAYFKGVIKTRSGSPWVIPAHYLEKLVANNKKN